MRISTSLLFSQGLNAIQRQQADLAQTQLQVATGKAILRPSDDPVGAKEILDLKEALSRTQQFQRNADSASARLGLSDSVLGSVTDVLQRVRELALQANNATLTSADRSGVAAEVEQRLNELVGLANSTDGRGEFLYSGFSSRTRPFQADGAGNFLYNGDQGRREIAVGPNVKIQDGNPGSEVFVSILNGNGTFAVADTPGNTGTGVIDPGVVTDLSAWIPDTYTVTFTTATTFEVLDSGANLVTSGSYAEGGAIAFNGVQTSITGSPALGDQFTLSASVNQDMFTTVQNLYTALRTDTGGSQLNNSINSVLEDLDQSLENILQVRAGAGARLNAVESETNLNADIELLIQQDLSSVENVDLTEVITLLNRQTGALTAAHQSFARLQNLSLFNFL